MKVIQVPATLPCLWVRCMIKKPRIAKKPIRLACISLPINPLCLSMVKTRMIKIADAIRNRRIAQGKPG